MKVRTFVSLCVCLIALIAFSLASTGCTAFEKTPPAAKKTTEPYRVEKEGKIPPLAPTDVRKAVDEEEKYEDLPVTEDGVVVEEFTPLEESPPSPPAGTVKPGVPASVETQRDTMMGYRIQIFASANEAAARSVREAAEVSVGVAAYVEIVDGVYKVRAGDCPSRPEAEALLEKCRSAGYGDAWIATTRIFMPLKKTP
jgi:hypothetical protein